MIERTIEQAPDGSYFSTDAITLEYNEEASKGTTQFFLSPNILYSQVHDYITSLSGAKVVETDDVEQNKLKKRMTSLIRACIKGGLIVWGDDLLTLLYGTKQHERPEKKTDIVDWYMDQFTKISIAYMMKSDIVLVGSVTSHVENRKTIQVSRCFTRPVTQKKSADCIECQ